MRAIPGKKQWMICRSACYAQVSQAQAAISKEQQLKEQLREQMTSATNDSKRQARAVQQPKEAETCLLICIPPFTVHGNLSLASGVPAEHICTYQSWAVAEH